jgi:hypothetical protein
VIFIKKLIFIDESNKIKSCRNLSHMKGTNNKTNNYLYEHSIFKALKYVIL